MCVWAKLENYIIAQVGPFDNNNCFLNFLLKQPERVSQVHDKNFKVLNNTKKNQSTH